MIITDSVCDIRQENAREWGIEIIPMTFMFNEDERIYSDYDIAPEEFYDMMRNGRVAKTSAINTFTFREKFEPILESGVDILYICFSSGLSNTYSVAAQTVEELKKEYGEGRIRAVDSLSGSAGQGLLVYLAAQMKKSGASIDAVEKFVIDSRLNVCHWFTVDDLVYLRRGGRISKATALIGEVLGIKPVMHMDNNGKLVAVSKVRGRKIAIKSIAEKYAQLALNASAGTVFISHGDCREDAELLGKMLKEKCGAEVFYYTNIGPVIGSHSGPGTLALFFLGKER